MARAGHFREEKNLVSHLSHEHLLKEAKGNSEEFMCKACCTIGDGVSYVCTQNCDFSLHEICARAETFISSHIHQHKLELNWEGLGQDQDLSLEEKIMRTLGGFGGGQNDNSIHGHRHCDVCEEEVVGLYYRCTECDDFYIHPVCTKFPKRLPHVIDGKHDLTFQRIMVNPVSPSLCSICHGVCSSPWRYRCGPCGYYIHLECVIKPLPSSASSAPPPQPDFLCRSAAMPTQSPPVTHQQKSMVDRQKSEIHYHHQGYFPNDHVAIGVPLGQPYHYGSHMQAQTPYQHFQHSITPPAPFYMFQQHWQQPSSQPEMYQKHQQMPYATLGMHDYQQQPNFIPNQMHFMSQNQQQPYMKPDPMYDMSQNQQQPHMKLDPMYDTSKHQQFTKADPEIQENTGTVSSELPSSSSSGNEKKRFKKRRIFGIVARIAITLGLGVAFGLPIPF